MTEREFRSDQALVKQFREMMETQVMTLALSVIESEGPLNPANRKAGASPEYQLGQIDEFSRVKKTLQSLTAGVPNRSIDNQEVV